MIQQDTASRWREIFWWKTSLVIEPWASKRKNVMSHPLLSSLCTAFTKVTQYKQAGVTGRTIPTLGRRLGMISSLHVNSYLYVFRRYPPCRKACNQGHLIKHIFLMTIISLKSFPWYSYIMMKSKTLQYNESHYTMKNEIEDNIRKWKHVPCF